MKIKFPWSKPKAPLEKLFLVLGKLWHEKATSLPIRIAIVFTIIQIGLIIFLTPWLPPIIPIFYSRPWGTDQLASPQSLIILPLISLSLAIINGLIGATIYEKNELAGKITIWGGALVAVFSTIAILRLTLTILV